MKQKKQEIKNETEIIDERSMLDILYESEEKSNKIIERVKRQIDNQEEKLKEKLKRRKSRHILSKSNSTTETNESLLSEREENRKHKFPLPFTFEDVIKENE